MNLSNPSALLWAALAVPIVLFYLTRVRVRELPVGTDLFWAQVFEPRRRPAMWRRLRHLASLLVQLAILALLVFALTDPLPPWDTGEPRRVVLVLDVSASMTARAPGEAETRLDHAKRAARTALAGIRDRDAVALVLAGGQPKVACGMTDDHRLIRDEIAAATATDAPASLTDAVALARRLLAGHPNGEVVAVTDNCGTGLTDTTDVRLVTVGGPIANVGITRFQARRSPRDPTGYELLVEVRNFDDAPAAGRLYLELNGVVADVIPLHLAANERWQQVFEKASATGGRLLARLDSDDGLAADNQAWAVLPRYDPVPVALVSEGNRLADLFVEKVLEACPLVAQPPALVGKGNTVPPGTAVTVFHRTTPAKLPAGPVLVIDPVGPSDQWDVGEPAVPLVGRLDRDSPLLSHVRLDNVPLPGNRRLTPKGKAQVFISSAADEPLCFTVDRPEGRVVVLGIGLEQGDLPLRVAFPFLVTNALTWLTNRSAEAPEAVAAGGFAEIAPPKPTAGEWHLWDPDGSPRRLPAADRLRVGPLDRRGIWRVAASADGPAAVELACNLSDPRESDLRPAASATGAIADRENTAFPRAVWFYLAALVVGALVVEWVLFQRRRIA
jgi:hypothetical protein